MVFCALQNQTGPVRVARIATRARMRSAPCVARIVLQPSQPAELLRRPNLCLLTLQQRDPPCQLLPSVLLPLFAPLPLLQSLVLRKCHHLPPPLVLLLCLLPQLQPILQFAQSLLLLRQQDLQRQTYLSWPA